MSPVKITKTGKGKFRVSTPEMVHAESTTLKKAKAQERLLNAVEHNPNWKPRKSIKAKRKIKK